MNARPFQRAHRAVVSMFSQKLWRTCCRGKLMYWALGILLAFPSVTLAAPPAQKAFASPEAAVAALVEAIKQNNQPMQRAILGAQAGKLISSGDAVADERGRSRFIQAHAEASKIVREGDARATLVIGKDEWPLPIPLVKSKTGWRFDTRLGEKEILTRRIGRNELAAIQVCLAIVDAERDYAAQRLDAKGVPEYAPRFVSTKGKRDGLYWQTTPDEPLSPLGPLLATATSEGYPGAASSPLAPYHGYYYRMLMSQGKNAPGGAHDYMVRGRMIGGFAVIAYPARYGASGIMSFMVNQDGVVHEKNIGKNTAAIASRMTTYNPDASWKKIKPDSAAKDSQASHLR